MEQYREYGWKDFLSFLYILLILIRFYPYEFYSAYPFLASSNNRMTFLALAVITMIITLTIVARRGKSGKIPSVLFIIVIMQCFWMVINSIQKNRVLGLGAFITPLLALVMVYFIYSSCGMHYFMKKYNAWILLMTSMGTLAFVLVRFGLLNPLFPFIDLSDDDMMYNFGLTFSQQVESSSFAFCGFFDEPGAIAQWSLFALLFNRLFMYNEKIEVYLIGTTLLSFSMGYYIQIIVYILLFHAFVRNHKRNWSISVLIFIIIGVFIYSANSTKLSQNEDVYSRSIGRMIMAFEDSQSQGIAVDDREIFTEEAVVEFRQNPLWGTSKENVKVGHNIYEPLALYGIIGTIFLYIPFIILIIRSIRQRDYELLKCMIVIVLGFTHRPFHGNLLFYFIIYCFVAMCYQRNKVQLIPNH